MNNIKKVLIVVLLAILSLLIIIFNNKSNNDTLLIKKEYEKLNNLVDLNGNKYYEVSISKYANIDIVDLKEVKDILKSKTGVIYFGDSKSLNSRIAIEVLLNAKENTNSGNTCEFNIDNFEFFGESKDSDSDEKKILAMKAWFISDIGEARMIARKLGNSRLFVLHVEHDWLHYEDFCKHGLIEMWKYAHEYKDENVFIVLDCINITYAEGGLKPLLDVITNKASRLLGTALKFPNNLHILATVLPWKDTEKSVGIELNKELFVPYWKKYNNDTLLPYKE